MSLFDLFRPKKKLESLVEASILSREIDKAYRDSLTDCYNKAYIEKLNATGLPGNLNKLTILDLTDFSKINSKYGRIMGDKLLKASAQMINSYIQRRGIVARYDADKFMIFTSPLEDQDRMLNALKEKFDAYYRAKLAEITEAKFSTATVYTCKDISLKSVINEANEQLKRNKANAYIRIGISKGTIGVVERRQELALYLKYLLGQIVIDNNAEREILFRDIEKNHRDRIFYHKRAIENAKKDHGIDVNIFMDYTELFEYLTSDQPEGVIFYKLREGDYSLSTFLDAITPISPRTAYIIPLKESNDPLDKRVIEEIKEKKFPTVILSKEPRLAPLLDHLCKYDLAKWAMKRSHIESPTL